MQIKESLQQLMKQEGLTAEQVKDCVEELKLISVEHETLRPFYQLNDMERAILDCFIGTKEVDFLVANHSKELGWASREVWKGKYNPVSTYRINPDFVIPDLEETKPRYKSGTLLANTLNGGVVEVVGVDTWRGKPSNESSYRYVIKNSNGELCSISGNDERYQPLPPRHDLKEGWEYTGKAAKIDKATKLAEGERWVSIFGEIIDPPALPRQDFNQWRHIARKKKEEPKQDFKKDFESPPVAYTAENGKEEPKPVEHVDLPVEIESGYIVVIHPDYAGGVPIQLFLKDAKLIGFVFADGITRCDIRPLNPDGGPALIPTHVRLAKGEE